MLKISYLRLVMRQSFVNTLKSFGGANVVAKLNELNNYNLFSNCTD
jgi:hypothetical protein